MDEQIQTISPSEVNSTDVTLSKRHLVVVGVILALIAAPMAGLVYGIPLLFKKELRSIGFLVIGLAFLWTILTYWFVLSGYGAAIFKLLTL